jgi:outer membrane immunogenic protein
MLRNTFAAIFAAGLALPGAAHATDLYVPETPIYEIPVLWPGFYIGGHIGGAFGNVDVTDTYDYVGDPIKESSFRTPGLLTGIQVGYNLQNGNIVYGIEADLGFMSLSGDGTADLPPPDDYGKKHGDPRLGQLTGNYSAEGGIYGDLTGRVGYANDDILFYVKGGAAFLNADFSAKYVGANCSTVSGYNCGKAKPSVFEFDASETLFGWTLGFGVEYALSPSWSLKVEYQHFDFGDVNLDHNGIVEFSPKGCPGCKSKLKGDADFDVTVDTVKLGVNYQIGKEDALQ